MTPQQSVVSPKKLIEVALPLDAINTAAAREKSIRHGHPSTLHLWWARRPLAAARAVIFAQLVHDPEDLWRCQNPGVEPNAQVRGHWTKSRARLFSIIEELVLWANTTNEAVLEKAPAEIRKAWRETCELNKKHPDAATLAANGLEVVVVDPLYLSLLDSSDANIARNVYGMGAKLQPIGEIGQRTRATIIVLHHFKRSAGSDPGEPESLEMLSQSGVVEWARQWILLQRRSPYQSDGRHELWLRAGGSAGHAGLWAVDADEGHYDASSDVDTRGWDVLVKPQHEAIQDAQAVRSAGTPRRVRRTSSVCPRAGGKPEDGTPHARRPSTRKAPMNDLTTAPTAIATPSEATPLAREAGTRPRARYGSFTGTIRPRRIRRPGTHGSDGGCRSRERPSVGPE